MCMFVCVLILFGLGYAEGATYFSKIINDIEMKIGGE